MSPNPQKQNRITPITLGVIMLLNVVAAVVLYAVYVNLTQSSDDESIAIVEPYRGTDYEPPLQLQDFTLTSHIGDTVSLSDLSGQPVMLFFGFTNCPDVCPLTLVEFKLAKTLLQDQGDRIKFVFISFDGERDTPDVLADFIDNYDSDFIALTGDNQTVTRIGQDFGAEFERIETTHSPNHYSIEHTARSYLIDSKGRLRVTFSYGTEADILAERMRELIDE